MSGGACLGEGVSELVGVNVHLKSPGVEEEEFGTPLQGLPGPISFVSSKARRGGGRATRFPAEDWIPS